MSESLVSSPKGGIVGVISTERAIADGIKVSALLWAAEWNENVGRKTRKKANQQRFLEQAAELRNVARQVRNSIPAIGKCS
jgi:hypothetical protein